MKFITISRALLLVLLMFFSSSAQHRGDNLSFQGLSAPQDFGIKPLAMGGAYTSIKGDISAINYNPAALSGIKGITFFASGSYFSKSWRENQDYRPNRFFVTLPFYLEGLYTPLPENNNRWDHLVTKDSNYYVNSPEMGLDPFSEEAADWKNERSSTGFKNLAAAMGFDFSGYSFVISAAYTDQDIFDYDRNDSYLSPHIGYSDYGPMAQVNGVDTLVLNWSRFMRERNGSIKNSAVALSFELNKYLSLGIGGKYYWGETDDIQFLDRVGSFDLIRENRFRFYYQNQYEQLSGTSKYSGMGFNMGFLVSLNNFNVGIKIDLPYTLEREWNYTSTRRDTLGTSTSLIGGTDEFKFPLIAALGVSFHPSEFFTISFDYEYAPYSQSEVKLASADSSFRNWQDRQSLKFGVEYKPFQFLSVLAGYRNIPEIFVPDGAAFRDRGPDSESYTFGVSLGLFIGTLDLAYEIRKLKYYDSYFSNTNYVHEMYNRFLFGFTYNFN